MVAPLSTDGSRASDSHTPLGLSPLPAFSSLTDRPIRCHIPPLLGASVEELTQWVQAQQQPAYRGKQLHQWIYQQGVRSLSDISVFPKSWRESLAEVPVGRSNLHYRTQAPDGTVKYLLRLADGQIVETVGIPSFEANSKADWGAALPVARAATGQLAESDAPAVDIQRLTVCVSSQVGCPMACDFCATGKGGFQRNLQRHEIVDQVLTVQEDFGRRQQYRVHGHG